MNERNQSQIRNSQFAIRNSKSEIVSVAQRDPGHVAGTRGIVNGVADLAVAPSRRSQPGRYRRDCFAGLRFINHDFDSAAIGPLGVCRSLAWVSLRCDYRRRGLRRHFAHSRFRRLEHRQQPLVPRLLDHALNVICFLGSGAGDLTRPQRLSAFSGSHPSMFRTAPPPNKVSNSYFRNAATYW